MHDEALKRSRAKAKATGKKGKNAAGEQSPPAKRRSIERTVDAPKKNKATKKKEGKTKEESYQEQRKKDIIKESNELKEPLNDFLSSWTSRKCASIYPQFSKLFLQNRKNSPECVEYRTELLNRICHPKQSLAKTPIGLIMSLVFQAVGAYGKA